MDAPNIYNLANFMRAVPDRAVVTVESSLLNVLPVNMMGMAMGLHVRCGFEDNLWVQDRQSKEGTAQHMKQLVRITRAFARDIANCDYARRHCTNSDKVGQAAGKE